jgi:hypothetical protein
MTPEERNLFLYLRLACEQLVEISMRTDAWLAMEYKMPAESRKIVVLENALELIEKSKEIV